MLAARPYARSITEVIFRLARRANPEMHPLLAKRTGEKELLIIITSDKGLCGSFNSNIIRKTTELIAQSSNGQLSLITIGKKGATYFKKRQVTIRKEYIDFFRNFSYRDAAAIAAMVKGWYIGGEVDRVRLVYNEFGTVIQQRVMVKTLLPIDVSEAGEAKGPADQIDYLYEPSASQVLDVLLSKYVEVQIYQALLESFAGEHGARMTAMDSATKNASEMIDRLTLLFNKVRQASITKELIEVVSGADALKG